MKWGSKGTSDGQFRGPSGLSIDANDNIYVTDKNNDRIQIFTSSSKVPSEERFFSSIYGYSDIKKLLMRAIVSRESISILLCGPSASSKTVFLMEMMKELDNTCYIDCTNTTGAGLIDKLFSNNIQYLLLDEIEKMSKRDQNVLLNVIETGMLIETKVSKTRSKQVKNLKVFATTNNVDALSRPLRSRFMEFYLPEYIHLNSSMRLLEDYLTKGSDILLKLQKR